MSHNNFLPKPHMPIFSELPNFRFQYQLIPIYMQLFSSKTAVNASRPHSEHIWKIPGIALSGFHFRRKETITILPDITYLV